MELAGPVIPCQFVNFAFRDILLLVAFRGFDICKKYSVLIFADCTGAFAIILEQSLGTEFNIYAPLSSASADDMGISLVSRVKILFSLMAEGFSFRFSSSGISKKIFRIVSGS